jgi:hypothetical protein
MDYDEEKVDEYALALLYLVVHERQEGFRARAWKGFDWDTMNRLHEKGLITNPVSKAKSVGMTEEGFKKSENLFKFFFYEKLNRLRRTSHWSRRREDSVFT